MPCLPSANSHGRLNPHNAALVDNGVRLSDNSHDIVPATLCNAEGGRKQISYMYCIDGEF